ncbi:MAG TPA: hypothetical protein VM513_25455 [Kofleriaceae bacterium]|jgi:hypothetical protein|nr:hypothetical protein [Kofleriaceae bacterium]
MKLVGERRALAAAVFAFYFLAYAMLVLSGALPPEFGKAFIALAGVYGLAFFSLVAGYFWARWYAVGVGLYGVITSAVGIWQIGGEPVLLFMGGTHLAAALLLWGNAMSQPYDGQTAWREKLHMDDNAVQRLGRSVIRAGVSLPFILLYAFAPKPGGEATVLAMIALVLAGVGFRGLVKAKTWGVLSLGISGALLVSLAGADLYMGAPETYAVRPAIAGSLLLAAVAPFVLPMTRFLSRSISR